MEVLVLDSSAALAWVMIDEGLAEPAGRLMRAAARGELMLVAPSLWPYEVASGLRRAMRRGRVDADLAWEALRQLLQQEVVLYPHEEPISLGWWLMRSHGVSSYDASYLGLAQHLGSQCITADLHLINAVSDTGLTCWLGDYGR